VGNDAGNAEKVPKSKCPADPPDPATATEPIDPNDPNNPDDSADSDDAIDSISLFDHTDPTDAPDSYETCDPIDSTDCADPTDFPRPLTTCIAGKQKVVHNFEYEQEVYFLLSAFCPSALLTICSNLSPLNSCCLLPSHVLVTKIHSIRSSKAAKNMHKKETVVEKTKKSESDAPLVIRFYLFCFRLGSSSLLSFQISNFLLDSSPLLFFALVHDCQLCFRVLANVTCISLVIAEKHFRTRDGVSPV
jgi:hypothetical protein